MLFAEEAGNPDGLPLLLVHGFLSSAVQWDLNRAELGEHYRLIIVELPGHGRSPVPAQPHGYSVDALVAGFEQVRLDHGIDTWWVCGQSLGAGIAIQYCLARPGNVDGLIFTNSRAAFGIKRQGLQPDLSSTRDLSIHPVNAKRLEPAIRDRMVAAADAMSIEAVQRFIERRHTWSSVERMSELTMPVLLVNGRWESAFQPHVETVREVIAHVQIVDVEGGHAINAEQPLAFNTAVIEFISRHTEGQPPC